MKQSVTRFPRAANYQIGGSLWFLPAFNIQPLSVTKKPSYCTRPLVNYMHGSHFYPWVSLTQPTFGCIFNSEDIGAHRDWESCPVTELIFNISDLYNAQT